MIYPFVSSEIYTRLAKNIWTEKDYPQMGWHDSTIYAMAFKEDGVSPDAHNEFILDIDYMFEWVKPVESDKTFTFWVAPCTLSFKDVSNLNVEYSMPQDRFGDFRLEVSDIKCENPTGLETSTQAWTIELSDGTIKFISTGFEQIVRKLPLHTRNQQLTLEHRDNINFGLAPCKIPKS